MSRRFGPWLFASDVIVAPNRIFELDPATGAAADGIYTVTITLNDDDLEAAHATTTAVVTGVGLIGGQLQIVGTSAGDHVGVSLTGSGAVRVFA